MKQEKSDVLFKRGSFDLNFIIFAIVLFKPF